MKGKEIKSFLPITYVSEIFVSYQKNWATLTKEAYGIYMTFKKLSYYLYDSEVTIKCDHAPLHKCLTAHNLISKVNNWGPEIANMSHVTFGCIKGIGNIFANSISHLRSIYLYDPLDPEGEGKEFGHDIFKELPP